LIQCKNCRHQNQDNAAHCARCSIPLHETEINKVQGGYQLQSSDGKLYPISGTETTIGRKGNLSFPDDGFMSREHAKIVNAAGGLTLQDLDSQNGTFINGNKIRQAQKINIGDKIKCGNTVFTVKTS
jgi:pSer/pThr/pTyr-binding forkhead associated (FHA) protein